MPHLQLPLVLILFNLFALPFAFSSHLSHFVPLSRQKCPVVLPNANPAQLRVIGGSSASPSIQSFLVSLSHPNNSFACTGSVISTYWVLTAAHCLVRPDWKLRVAAARAATTDPIPIRRVIAHQSYIPGRLATPGDIALIELAAPIPSSAAFIVLNDNPIHPQPGAFARTAGYGRVVSGAPPDNPTANQVDAPVNSPDRCRIIYNGYLNIVPKLFICVGYDKSRCRADSCHGDSGGPLFQYDNRSQPIQIGVVSFGLQCGSNGIPGVSVRISSFLDWMSDHGAVFYRSGDISSHFGDGSNDAASNQTNISVFQSDPPKADDPRFLLIPKATFIIICVIACIAIIALAIFSVTYIVSSRRSSSTDASPEMDEGDTIDRNSLPNPRHLFGTRSALEEQDTSSVSLHTACSTLPLSAQPQPNARSKSRTPAPPTDSANSAGNGASYANVTFPSGAADTNSPMR